MLDLAEEHDVGKSSIRAIINREHWKHVMNKNFFDEDAPLAIGQQLRADPESCRIGDMFPCSNICTLLPDSDHLEIEIPSKGVKARFKKVAIDIYHQGQKSSDYAWERTE